MPGSGILQERRRRAALVVSVHAALVVAFVVLLVAGGAEPASAHVEVGATHALDCSTPDAFCVTEATAEGSGVAQFAHFGGTWGLYWTQGGSTAGLYVCVMAGSTAMLMPTSGAANEFYEIASWASASLRPTHWWYAGSADCGSDPGPPGEPTTTTTTAVPTTTTTEAPTTTTTAAPTTTTTAPPEPPTEEELAACAWEMGGQPEATPAPCELEEAQRQLQSVDDEGVTALVMVMALSAGAGTGGVLFRVFG